MPATGARTNAFEPVAGMARSYGKSMKPSVDNPRETRARIALLAPAWGFLRPYWPRVLGASAALVFTASVTLGLGQACACWSTRASWPARPSS